MKVEDVLQVVLDEVNRATKLFPSWPTDPLHALIIVGEELGETVRETLQVAYEPEKTSRRETVREEAIQLAAMSIRFLLSIDRYEFTRSPQHTQGDDDRRMSARSAEILAKHFADAKNWRCPMCAEIANPSSDRWRWGGYAWQHHHEYPVGHVDAERMLGGGAE